MVMAKHKKLFELPPEAEVLPEGRHVVHEVDGVVPAPLVDLHLATMTMMTTTVVAMTMRHHGAAVVSHAHVARHGAQRLDAVGVEVALASPGHHASGQLRTIVSLATPSRR